MARVVLAVFAALGVFGCWLGWGTDRDSVRVVGSAIGILHGHYERSRSFGFPLHEFACAGLYWLGGLRAVNFGSLVVCLAGVGAALAVARRAAPVRDGVAALALCGSPLLLVNASSAIDFGWCFAGGMGLLLAALRGREGRGWVWFFGAVLALVLVRPDNVLFGAAVTLALMIERREWRPAVAFGAACVVAACVYLGLNGVGMLAHGVSTTRPLLARAGRAVVLLSAVLGPGGALGLAMLAPPADGLAGFLRRVAWLCWGFYLPRFVLLPDQADYLILPMEMTVLAAVVAARPALAWGFAALVALPSLVTVSLLGRDPVSAALRVAVAPHWGALAQDWAARAFASRMERMGVARFVAAGAGGAPLRYDIYMPGYVSGDGDLVIGQDQVFHLVDARAGVASLPTVPRGWYRGVYGCAAPLGPGIGWRGWEAPVAATVLDIYAVGRPLACSRVDKEGAFGAPMR
jgi:hypothetical protein